MSESPVHLFGGDDPEMLKAHAVARANFRYLWREIVRDRGRIVPALEMAAVKAPFSDPKPRFSLKKQPQVEHMWISDVDFDGQNVTGTLINSPNWLKSVKEGDDVSIPLAQISDWMFATDDEVYGAFTVNLLRSRMEPGERREHDQAWGLDFGDPAKPRKVSEKSHQELEKTVILLFEEHFANDPDLLDDRGHLGWTALHSNASAGGAAIVGLLLEKGADRAIKTDLGFTALDLAKILGWKEVIPLLEGN